VITQATKSQLQVKMVLPFSMFMKRPQTKFHADTMRNSKVIRSKKSKFIVWPISCSPVFLSWSIFY